MMSKNCWDDTNKDKEFGVNTSDKKLLGIPEVTYWLMGIKNPIQCSGLNLQKTWYT